MERTYQLYIKSTHKPIEVVADLYRTTESLEDISNQLKCCLALFDKKPDLLDYDSDFFSLLLSAVIMKNYGIRITSANTVKKVHRTLDKISKLIDNEHVELLKRYINHLSVM